MAIKLVIVTALFLTIGPVEAPISPGRWEVTNQLQESSVGGQRQSFSTANPRPVMVCLKPAEAMKGPGLAFSDPELCAVNHSEIEQGRYEYELKCRATDSGDNILTKATGFFTTTDYNGEALSIQNRGMLRIEMRSKIIARRVGDC